MTLIAFTPTFVKAIHRAVHDINPASYYEAGRSLNWCLEHTDLLFEYQLDAPVPLSTGDTPRADVLEELRRNIASYSEAPDWGDIMLRTFTHIALMQESPDD